MPVRFPSPPQEPDQAIESGLSEIRTAAQPAADTRFAELVSFSDKRYPHEIFSARLDDLRKGQGVASAQPEGWRYLLGSAPTLTSAEVARSTDSDEYLFLGVNSGPFNESFEKALANVSGDDRVRNGDFECRVLRVNALYLVALWLHTKASGEDLFVPLAPTFSPFVAGRVYPVREFDELLTTAAREKPDDLKLRSTL
jgi:hypothetical protein